MINEQIIMTPCPIGEPPAGHFALITGETGAPIVREVLVESLFLSLGPFLRGLRNKMAGRAAPRVHGSCDNRFATGELVACRPGRQTHRVEAAEDTRSNGPGR